MENERKEIDLIDLARKVWADRRRIFKWVAVGIGVGLVVAFSLPKEYTSTVQMAPEGDAATTATASGAMGALANMVGANGMNGGSGLNAPLYPSIVSSTPFLLEFAPYRITCRGERMSVEEYILHHQREAWWMAAFKAPIRLAKNLFKGPDTLTVFNSPDKLQRYMDVMQQRIFVTSDAQTGTLSVNSMFQDPLIAKNLADSVVVRLQEYMTRYKTAKTRATLESNSRMLDEAKARYYKADMQYAAALDHSQNLVKRSAGVQLDRLRNERDLAFQLYEQIAGQVELNQVKLQEDTPIVTVIEPAKVEAEASSPKKVILLVLFAFMGGVVGVGVSMVRLRIFRSKETA